MSNAALPFIYLASQSSRRRMLLEQINVPYRLLLPDEGGAEAEALEAVFEGEVPAEYAMRVTKLKLEAANARLKRLQLERAPVLCADTCVSLNGEIFGKAENKEEATAMLLQLAGGVHDVHTAVALTSGCGDLFEICSHSRVTFASMTPAQISDYVATMECLGKAGGYAIQGAAAKFISRVEGSFSAIVGLPLYEVANLLRQIRFFL